MTAQESYNLVDPTIWAKTPIVERLEIIESVQKNLQKYSKEWEVPSWQWEIL